MARYNSVNSISSVAGGNTISTPSSGLLTTLTGSGTVIIPNPVLYAGATQTYYNAAGVTLTLSTNSLGNFVGPGASGSSTQTLAAGAVITLVSDGTNYLTQSWIGGPVSTTTLTATGAVTFNPAGSSISLQPTGVGGTVTIAPGTTAGTIDRMNIGATTAGTGAFTTLEASGVTKVTANTAATLGTGGTGALQVSGGTSVAGILNVGGKSYFGDYIGIGQNNPASALVIKGTVGTNSTRAQVTDGTQFVSIGQWDGTNNRIEGSGTYPMMITSYYGGIKFGISGVTNMFLDTNGNLSMGSGAAGTGVSLDMSSRTDSMIIPVGTTAQRPATGINGMIRKNSTTGYVEYWDPGSSSWIGIGAFAASGGDVVSTYTSGPNTYKYHQFTTSGTFQVLSGAKGIEYMIIGGGGGGGTLGGGGGAGGYLTGTFTASVGSYGIVIGGGANGGSQGAPGGTGTNTTALGFTAYGGGGGGSHTSGGTSVAGTSGGSGGGSGDNASSYPYGAGTVGQGNRGGTGSTVFSNIPRGGGGGGGSNGVGLDIGSGGAGGPGTLNAINGTSYYWAGGGGYGGYASGSRGGDGGIGGGGGGSAANGASPAGSGGGSALNNGTAGAVGDNTMGGLGGQNTGGGGGGSGWAYNATGTRSGGSGIVIIRYTV